MSTSFIKRFVLLSLLTAQIFTTSQAFANKVFKYSEDGSPTNFDPVESGTTYSNDIVTAVFDTLYEYKYLKRPYELKPSLADGMPVVSKDGLTYTIKMKKGVHFQDDPSFPNGKGREVIAEDFVYSLKRHFDASERSQGAWLWQEKIVGLDEWKTQGSDYKKPVEGLKALDSHTIQIKLKKQFPQLMYTFAMGYAALVPKEAVDKYGREFSIKPVGSGPWIMKSHNTKQTVLIKNPNYRKDIFDAKAEGYDEKVHGGTGIDKLDGKQLPIADTIEVNWMKEMVARWNSFTKGNEIMWTVLQNEQVEEVLESKNPVKLRAKFAEKYNFRYEPEGGFIFTTFNMDFPEIGQVKDPKQNAKNKALRCAITKATNWPQKIERFYLGLGEAWPGVIPPMLGDFDPKMSKESVTQDIPGAKKLLADNGWTPQNFPVLEYGAVSDVRSKQLFEHFRGNLALIGYPQNKVKFKTYATFGDFNKDVKNRKVMLIPMGWGLDYPDAENTLALYYGPNAAPGSNAGNYVNPEYDKLFAEATVMQPSPKRTELYRKLNQMIVDDCATMSGFSRTRIFLWHKNAVIWPQREIVGNIYKYLDVR